MSGSRRIRPGDGIGKMSAAVYNNSVDLYERSLGVSPKGGSINEPRQQTRITVRNDTGGDLDRFNIIGFGNSLIDPTVNLDDFQGRFLLSGQPANIGNLYQWGILDEPIPNGQYGLVIVSGLACVQIQVSGGNVNYAAPNTTNYSLSQADCGICRVLYCSTSAGLNWAIVNLG